MIGTRTPRLLLLTVALGVAVAGIMLTVFYGQYRWLASEIIETSSGKYDRQAAASFERQARHQIHTVADRLIENVDLADPAAISIALNAVLADNSNLTGIRLARVDAPQVDVGAFPQSVDVAGATWLDELLIVSYPVEIDGVETGVLAGSFDLAELRADSSQFAQELVATETAQREASYLWAAGGTLLALLLCGVVVWLIVRGQTKRIRQLKVQAEKLRDADFGEPLPESRRDELGALAAVFNDMRQKLKTTTHSRDYVDSILSGMNEAIIVTNDEGRITRINMATTHLLGYEEDELIGTTIDYVTDSKKSHSIADETPSGLPREAMFESKYGESIPVSYTCSIVGDGDGSPKQRIYAAQNITERRRAEKRIRYLARIDPLTKIPNRMQFQHLLQRGIARARRANKSLCLFYLDIDHFKEINDTFGHLAGDTTLETVAERLRAALPNRSVVGRLAGDEFAVIVDDLKPDDAGIVETSELAQKLLNRLADPFFVQGHEVFMTASHGHRVLPQGCAKRHRSDPQCRRGAVPREEIRRQRVFSFYAPRMNEASVERLMTKSKLKRAFERDELLVHYQPKYNLETGEVFGAEALVRWELPERGLILPSDFIPIAEETNLIIEIGEWVLDKVCEDFRLLAALRCVARPGVRQPVAQAAAAAEFHQSYQRDHAQPRGIADVARTRDHRDDIDGESRSVRSSCLISCMGSACTWRSTTSARAIHRSARCSNFRSRR